MDINSGEIKMDKKTEITKVVLEDYVKNSCLLNEINTKIADSLKTTIDFTILYKFRFLIPRLVNALEYVGFSSIEEVEESLIVWREQCPKFSKRLLGRKSKEALSPLIALFHLCYLKLAVLGSEEKIFNYMNDNGIGEKSNKKWAKRILEIYIDISSGK